MSLLPAFIPFACLCGRARGRDRKGGGPTVFSRRRYARSPRGYAAPTPVGRGGAFWEARYHCTLVDGGEHAFNCIRCIDLNMVRAGVVGHPLEWRWCGHDELVGRSQGKGRRHRRARKTGQFVSEGVECGAGGTMHRRQDIKTESNNCQGRPCVRGTRVTVSARWDNLAGRRSLDEIPRS